MLGFPFCFYHSGLFGTTFGQSGGFSIRSISSRGYGIFSPGTDIWFFHTSRSTLRFSTIMSPCTTIQLLLSFYHLKISAIPACFSKSYLDFVVSRL
ncbi:hypothetical protein BDZ45DRAFT_86637 [Acephala macrosclerotiorum]|nr:hypothetical protein BDZ45DRAFT_86637 [Acephala macrosclerotiorum]